jgi:hypothetical protein
MRFGQVMWSQEESGSFKTEIVLVDKSYDDLIPPVRLLEPQMGNMQRSIVKNREALMAVVALLESKGVVNTEERGALLDVSASCH